MKHTTQAKNTRKGLTVAELLSLVAIITIIGSILFGIGSKCFGGKGFEYSDGQRTGIIYKISRKGVLWKTWEGELSMQMVERNSNGAVVPKVFQFSVSDPTIASELEAAAKTGKPVTVDYKEYKFRGFKYGSTNYDVTGVTAYDGTDPVVILTP